MVYAFQEMSLSCGFRLITQQFALLSLWKNCLVFYALCTITFDFPEHLQNYLQLRLRDVYTMQV